MHVIYSGLWQSPEAVIRTVADEDADWLGISLLSGAHLTLVPRIMQLLKEAGLEHVGVLIGGIIPEADVAQLLKMGVARVFGPGSPLPEIVEFLRERSASAMADASGMLAMDARRRLSRLLSQAVHGDDMTPSLAGLPLADKYPLVLAFTGSGGVGKSSLIGRLLPLIRQEHKTVAVLACDPESPVTGGALLGDRFRLASDAVDEGVFIRSLATPSGQESIAQYLPIMVEIIKRFGFDIILIETVGAGQGDVAVRDSADRTVLLLQPESGDDLQWEKAGILEVADVVVIHKADLPGAEQTEAQIKSMLELGAHRNVPILRVSSKDVESVRRLWSLLRELPANAERNGAVANRIGRLAHQQLDRWLRRAEANGEPGWQALIEQCRAGRLSDEQAAARMLALAAAKLK